MLNTNEVRRNRHQLKEQAGAILDLAIKHSRGLTPTEQKDYDSLNERIVAINEQLAKHQAGAIPTDDHDYPIILDESTQSTRTARPSPVRTSIREALQYASPVQRDEMESFLHHFRTGMRANADLVTTGDGGYLLPSFVSGTLERNYTQFKPVASVARLFATTDGTDVTFPVLSDSESGEQLASAAATGLDATVSGDTPPTALTGPKLSAFKISSKPVYVPRETVVDSDINILEEVIGSLLARVIRFENLRYTRGSGSGQAEGFLTNCGRFEEIGGHVDLDTALDLAYDVPALYRSNGVYMMTDTTAKYLRKLKTGISGDKQQLWADADATKGTPASLHGYPVVINNDMDDINSDGTYSGKKVLAFGDFSKFVIRQAENNTPYVYRWPIPAKDGIGALVLRRSDSKLIVPEAISLLTVGGS